MAAVIHGTTLNTTTNASVYTTASFTPVVNDLLVVFAYARQSLTRPATVTDSLSGTYTQILAIDGGASADTLYLFIADQLASGSALTVTFDVTGDAATGAIVFVARVSSMTRTGSSASLQTATESLQASGGTPETIFGASVLTGNPTLGFVGNQVNPATLTPPTNWTELADVGHTGPTQGAEYAHRDSGFTGTTITWGSTSGEVYGTISVELDTSAVAGGDPVAGLALIGATPIQSYQAGRRQ